MIKKFYKVTVSAVIITAALLMIKAEGISTYEAKSQPVSEAQKDKVVIHQGKRSIAKPAGKKEAEIGKAVKRIRNLPDPFQVDFMIKKKGQGEEAKKEETIKTFVLQGVIVGEKRSAALIDDTVLSLGDYIYGWKLIGIKKDRIGLKKDKQIKRLYLKLGGIQDAS